VWAGELFWGARLLNDTNARMCGIHACVPPGLVWRPP
jgi:hypothetical protein